MKSKGDMVEAIVSELELRSPELAEKTIRTIYFGGGTPSVLTEAQLGRILTQIKSNYSLSKTVEITLEANPDDLDEAALTMLLEQGVNRLSIGLQSFVETELTWMNRSHTVKQSIDLLDNLEKYPELSYSADLIFGLPMSNSESWQFNLETLANYRLPHLSCYNLTVETNTPLHHQIAKGKQADIDDILGEQQYLQAHNFLTSRGFEHYEVSNYSRPGQHSQHNTAYWFGLPYVGVGPAAHSFDGSSRSWNIANNAQYISSIAQGEIPLECEILTPENRFNEQVMTGLRTMWGMDLSLLDLLDIQSKKEIAIFLQALCQDDKASVQGGRLILTEAGRLHADSIASQLFL